MHRRTISSFWCWIVTTKPLFYNFPPTAYRLPTFLSFWAVLWNTQFVWGTAATVTKFRIWAFFHSKVMNPMSTWTMMPRMIVVESRFSSPVPIGNGCRLIDRVRCSLIIGHPLVSINRYYVSDLWLSTPNVLAYLLFKIRSRYSCDNAEYNWVLLFRVSDSTLYSYPYLEGCVS